MKRWWDALPPEEHERRIQKLMATGPSSIEKTVCRLLDVLGIAYKTQVPFANGRYIADIYIAEKKLVIECNGDYWHNLPERINRDKEFEAYLFQNNYKILWLWQKDILKNSEETLLKGLTQVIGGKQYAKKNIIN
ncbi:MAG: hypothetical protein DDT20_01228 [Firmicutes bacterium]|nr:hypothetical protein [Bacillota bacterium]